MSHTVLYSIAGILQVAAIIVGLVAHSLSTKESDKKHEEIIDGQSRTTNEINASISKALADVVESTSPAEQVAELKIAMGRLGAKTLSSKYPGDSGDAEGISSQVQLAIREIPAEIKLKRQAELDALIEEAAAQEHAIEINNEFRPKVAEVQSLITRILDEAEGQQLVNIVGRSEMFQLPSQIVFTTFAMSSNGIPEEMTDNALEIHFGDGTRWNFYLKNGMVRSPSSLASSWSAPTEKYFPMVRLAEHSQEGSQILATIWFHQDTGELSLAFNARNSSPTSLRDVIDRYLKTEKGESLISAVFIELLKNIRVRSA